MRSSRQPLPLKVIGKAGALDALRESRGPAEADRADAAARPGDDGRDERGHARAGRHGGDHRLDRAAERSFGGRVPVEVRNLPPRVRVLDVGLNGVLITEDESRRSFTLEALPSAEPGEQMIYVSGQVETRSGQQSSYAAPEGIRLVVKPKAAAPAGAPPL